jgi:hypothetical protein
MSGKILWDSLKPRLNTMKPDSPFGTFHNHLSLSLTEWLTGYFLPKQIFNANGMQYIPPAEEVTWSEPTNPLTPFKFVTPTIYISPAELITVFKKKQLAWAALFGLIGTKISSLLTTVICTVPGVAVVGGTAAPFMSAHFRIKGHKFFAALKKLDYSADNIKSGKITEQIWDKFEDYLVEAINSTPPTIFNVAGALPPGTFVGTVNAKLSL